MRGNKRPGGLAAFFYKERTARPASRSEVEAPVEISTPTNFKRVGHVSYRAATGLFSGLDSPISLFFGVPITAQPRMEVEGYADRIPSIIVLLAREMIKRDGLKAEGIFRVPGESDAVQKSKAALNSGRGMQALESEDSPHLFASLIKDWFRSLESSEVILQNITSNEITRMAKDTVPVQQTYDELCNFLPEPNRSIFVWLIDLLAIVCVHTDSNLMSPQAMATVFSPTLYAPEVTMASFALVVNVTKLIEKCIMAALERGDLEMKEQVFAN